MRPGAESMESGRVSCLCCRGASGPEVRGVPDLRLAQAPGDGSRHRRRADRAKKQTSRQAAIEQAWPAPPRPGPGTGADCGGPEVSLHERNGTDDTSRPPVPAMPDVYTSLVCRRLSRGSAV